jgi:U3 small nucleolar RNA-associated protein 21
MILLDGAPTEPARMNEPCPVAECEREGADAAANDVAPSMMAKKKDDTMTLTDDNDMCSDGSPPQAKEEGLITLSGLPPAHWKNLFHLELVKERNKPTEAPQKPPQAPFFLQWRSGLESAADTENGAAEGEANAGAVDRDKPENSDDGWDAVWSDDDGEDDGETDDMKPDFKTPEEQTASNNKNKRKKVVHHRSKLADVLQNCFDAKDALMTQGQPTYANVTSYLSKMGPSSVDVEISSLCYGIHDLEEGLPLLHMASMWLLEACESHQSFEAVNAYLHRFLHVHGNVITRIDHAFEQSEYVATKDAFGGDGDDAQKMKLKEFVATIAQLREKQKGASNRLQGKMQHTLCLLRHLSRMV